MLVLHMHSKITHYIYCTFYLIASNVLIFLKISNYCNKKYHFVLLILTMCVPVFCIGPHELRWISQVATITVVIVCGSPGPKLDPLGPLNIGFGGRDLSGLVLDILKLRKNYLILAILADLETPGPPN
ncbi:unnamed protein product [Meganyctiphanes norvegica]|uniref:Uncharacterized protein n=1 Tax=Meganyctiphanes norvegica TaxID=48144 RepID=A0AAV2QK51_MEGNR